MKHYASKLKIWEIVTFKSPESLQNKQELKLEELFDLELQKNKIKQMLSDAKLIYIKKKLIKKLKSIEKKLNILKS